MVTSKKEVDKQFSLLKRQTAEIISEEELLKKLKKAKREKRPLRVKLGIDASASDVHLGTAIPLFKLKEFQDLGHEAIFLIGDFTGMIGDPSGQSKTRRSLTKEQVRKNASSLKKQIFKILDPQRTKVVFNSSWCNRMNFADVIKLASYYTVAQLLERDDFEARYKKGQPIGIHEFLYPLIQGYDSVVLKADIEICGTDQRFNTLVARAYQQAYGQEPEVIMMMPILEGVGTKEKMSKSSGNYIGITDEPDDMFGKVMKITDEQIDDYFNLCTRLSADKIRQIDNRLKDEPKLKKEKLAYEIVKLYYDEETAQKARETFELKYGKVGRRLKKDLVQSEAAKEKMKKIAQNKKIPKSKLRDNKIWICRLLTTIDATGSNSEARRLIEQKAVKVDGHLVEDVNTELPLNKEGYLLEVGKRKIFNILFR